MEKIGVIIVGVEKSNFAGRCPGSELDARRMFKILKECSSNIDFLLNDLATVPNVKDALEKHLEDDLLVFYYSGHGGSQKFPDTGSEEMDGKDEFLCLYDSYLRDNDLWMITSGVKGRVFEIFDCCHSETMFQVPGFVPKERIMPRGLEGSANMLVWSGCPDSTVSYGSYQGGQFTNTFLKYFSSDDTYNGLWSKISSDSNLKKYEQVRKTIIGNFPEENQIFR